MSLPAFLALLGAGRLTIWLLQVNGLARPLWAAHPTLTELGECDLCLGFWVYLALIATHHEKRLLGFWPRWIEAIVLAAMASFTAHLIRLGWERKFGVTVV